MRRTPKSAIVEPRTDTCSIASPRKQGGRVLIQTCTATIPQPAEPWSTSGTRRGAPVIEIHHVTKRFQDYAAVRDAHFAINAGEFFAILGPSGCGKTSTLRMIAGFDTPTEGAIKLDGVDVTHAPPHKRNVNTVFQHYALFPHLTVWDNVAYGPRSRKKPKAEVHRQVGEMLEIVQLTELAQRKPAHLSGGQQQRVALARALVNYPRALLLDEPLGALDLKLRHAMQFELKRIQREIGITFVYVTHDQEEALTMSDRIAVLNQGNVEQIGTPTEMYDQPATIFVAGFIGQANLWQAHQAGTEPHGYVTVKVFGTKLKSRAGHTVIAPGAPAVVMVRPERITISTDQPAGAQTGQVAAVRAKVDTLHFQGPVQRLSLTAENGATIVAHLGPEHDSAPLRPGDDVFASWSPDAALTLPATNTPQAGLS